METRALVVALIAILNFAVDTLEKLVASDGAGPASKEKGGRKSRAKAKSKVEDEDEDDDEDEDEDEDDDELTEDKVVDAVRAAQKAIDRNQVAKIVKKYGKAERASEVKPENRAKLLAELKKAIDEADED